jgi:NAD(P)-dependent dehydrogenase (short-subunit alcohol dehydrogenase family)
MDPSELEAVMVSFDAQDLPSDLLAGRTALIAGGAGNVGRWIVAAFLRGGATVVVPSRSEPRLAALRAYVGEIDANVGDRLITLAGDLGEEADGARVRAVVLQRAGGLDAVVASFGGFVPAPSLLAAPVADLERALAGYVVSHFTVARTLLPALEERGGSYTFINGLLAFDPRFPGTGLISVASAAQAMLARVVMKERQAAPVRVNEVVLYTSFGRADDDARNAGGVSREAVARAVAWLASDDSRDVRGRTIHLDSPERVRTLVGSVAGSV